MTKAGHDYGIKPTIALIGDLNFLENFQKAECIGMAYIYGERDKEEAKIFQLGFIFRNDEYATLFMDSLVRWSDSSVNKGDAVGIDFIQKEDGKYAIAIYNKIENIIERMVPKKIQNKVIPLVVGPMHFKEIDISTNFLNFKRDYVQGQPVPLGYILYKGDEVVKQSEKFIIKHEFGLYNYTDNETNSQSLLIYRSLKSGEGSSKFMGQPMPQQTITEIEERRLTEIKLYFPILYNRITKLNWLSEIVAKLRPKYKEIIIIQAICNLVLFERLKIDDKINISDFSKKDNGINVLEYLNNTYESFNNHFPLDNFFTKYKIESQINRDSKQLINHLKQKK